MACYWRARSGDMACTGCGNWCPAKGGCVMRTLGGRQPTKEEKILKRYGKGYLNLSTVLQLVEVTEDTLWRMEYFRGFPKRVESSEGPVWQEKSVLNWISTRSDSLAHMLY